MNDLISREATVSILRARADMAFGDVKDVASFFDYCANMIEKIPAVDAVPMVDAVPVTRCKDCVYYECGEHFHDMQFCCRLYADDGTPANYNFGPNDFCSYGETPEEKQQREAAEQDAWDSMQAMCNPEDGSL